MGLRDFTFADVIARNSQLHGHHMAFVAGGQRISHRDYSLRVERLAAGPAAIGLVAGDRPAVQNCLACGQLMDFVGERIARFKRPRHVVFAAALPRNAQRQVDRARATQ